ncbi:MAG: CDP-alcohol phosphatidyltransferase family protein [Alphaproteobacteria bacterium]
MTTPDAQNKLPIGKKTRHSNVKKLPYDQRIARVLVRPLARTPVTPNHLTAVTLLLGLAAAGLFARGDAGAANWGAGVFVLARFLDHFDGELARLTGTTSRFGYYFDYLSGGISYAALFAGIGIGLSGGALGGWALLLGAAGALSAVASVFLNLGLDREMSLADGAAIGYPGIAGFELEDGIYLIAPVTWLGWLMPFFVACGIGAVLYCLWTVGTLLRARLARHS